MNDLADKPRVGIRRANPRQHAPPERWIDCIRRVQPPTRSAASEPHRHHVRDVVHHGGLVVIQFLEALMPFEHFYIWLAPRSAPMQVKPARSSRVGAVAKRVYEGLET